MSKAWPLVKLGEVLHKSQNWIELDPQQEYKEVTVRLWGKGVTLRGIVTGSQIAGSRRLQVHPNQFILSRIDARNGAFGLIPNELEGAIVSNDFPVFEIDRKKLLPEYLHWLSKTNNFVESCKTVSEGTTNRVRLKEEKFLQITMTLPNLADQQLIIAKIELLAGKIEEAKRIKNIATLQIEMLWRSELNNSFPSSSSNQKTLQDICEEIIDNLHSTPKYTGDSYPCIRSQDVGWGSINYMSALRTDEAEYIERTRRGAPKLGDIVYVREGDIGRCGLVDGTQQFSLGQRVMMLRPDKRKVIPKYLMLQLMSPSVLDNQIRNAKTGTTSHHINIKHLKTISIIVPSLEKQRQKITHLENIQGKLEKLKITRAQTAAELDAMLPSILDKAFKGEL